MSYIYVLAQLTISAELVHFILAGIFTFCGGLALFLVTRAIGRWDKEIDSIKALRERVAVLEAHHGIETKE